MDISDPVIFVTCNKCGHEEEFNQTMLDKSDWYKNLVEMLVSNGWMSTNGKGGMDICPSCVEILNSKKIK